jgi:hypothetical protein
LTMSSFTAPGPLVNVITCDCRPLKDISLSMFCVRALLMKRGGTSSSSSFLGEEIKGLGEVDRKPGDGWDDAEPIHRGHDLSIRNCVCVCRHTAHSSHV